MQAVHGVTACPLRRPQPTSHTCMHGLQGVVPRPAPLHRAQLVSLHPCRSANNSGPQSSEEDSDLVYVGKVAVFSFAGAAVIKYGSLLTPLAFSPNAALALAVVIGAPAAYALYILKMSQQNQQQ